MRIRNEEDLEEKIDKDLAWRKKEFTTLKLLIQDSRRHQRKILLRSYVALLYSHWEGHVKYCSQAYLSFIKCKGISYCDLKDNFFQLSLEEKFDNQFSFKSYNSQKKIVGYIRSECKEKFSVNVGRVIDTESNLKFSVFYNIMGKLGLDISPFELKKQFIDSMLLKMRNSIVHGEHSSEEELENIFKEIDNHFIGIIMCFNNAIKNAIISKSYCAVKAK